ncbi:40S ribosomal protein S2-3-like [Dendrobium catenatum]|uniref:40S ribosomal protein S2-4 n=1 Tax=Dendrobium catenatum TaxID=906689 RepID=A0A2I0WX18_9ASPA|nr:40S ribosomal protein S2-3-like [Dendrobium catenatum]PKU80205.1 40S ribosomal protein S2-4 [Dendrobium catenatum]
MERGSERGGFGRGFGRGDRGGRGRVGRGGGGRREDEQKWVPVTKLGRLVKEGKIASLEQVLQFAGIEDVFTSSRGSTKTLGNFVKATFDCLMKTYGFFSPDLWIETRFAKSPFQEYTDLLAKPTKEILDDVVERADD